MRAGVSWIFKKSSCLNLFFFYFSADWLHKRVDPGCGGPFACEMNGRSANKVFWSRWAMHRRSCRANGFCSVVFVSAPSPGPVIQPFPSSYNKVLFINNNKNLMKSVTYLLSAMKTANTSPNAWALSTSKYTGFAREIWIIWTSYITYDHINILL